MAAPLTSYDEIAYPSRPLPQTHPDRLAAVAFLHGLDPAPASRCRVLELGGGDGANLIPLAYAFPLSTFLGIDLAPTPVARGRRCVAELGLTNVELRCGDVMDLPADLGTFDYVIAHGLYSWVPAPVRDRVLALARDHLAPHGVAYVSYNVYPGCHVRQMVRGMMRFHTRAMPEPRRRIDQARACVKFVADGQVAPGAYGEVLREELRRAVYAEDEALLFHDDLAEVSDPVWFHEFVDHAAAHGLRFLAEAEYHTSDFGHLPDQTRDTLHAMRQADVVQCEQYLDFLKCRRFRQTLLVRQEAPVTRDPDPARVPALATACGARPEGEPDLAPGVGVTFREPKKDGAMSVDLPLAKAALLHLGECYPQAVAFPELVAAARARLGREVGGADEEALAEVLLAAFAAGMAELRTEPPRFAGEAGERPEASAVARWQLRAGGEAVTSLRHERVKVDHPLTRQLVLLMDGTRDRAALADELTAWVVAHQPPGQEAPPEKVRELLAEQIGPRLAQVAALALIHDHPRG
jgi:SAM-dependent methyltransferase/methyltransferase-like protein